MKDQIDVVLGSIRGKGVKLWSESGSLHYRAPNGILTRGDIDTLRTFKHQIVAFLDETASSEEPEFRDAPCSKLDRAPLTCAQLAHWNTYRLAERPAVRQIASATRLRGRLNVDALQKSIAEIVRRHDSLRTRVVIRDGVPAQVIDASSDYELRVDDLSPLTESSREVEAKRLVEELIMEPIDVARGPLFGIRLLKLRDDEHVLIVAMEHIISDAFSRAILLRELFTAYAQVSKGQPFCLPAIPVQLVEYAARQRNAEGSWIAERGAYWIERLTACQRLRFPEDKGLQMQTRVGWGTVPIKIGRNLRVELHRWCRLRQTTLVMGVLTAYIGLVLRWCNVSEAVIQYPSNRRANPEIENTIGCFASILYLRIELLEHDSFIDLMKRVTEEYCKAHEHDFSYVAVATPQPEFTRSPTFNWVPQGSNADASGLDGLDDPIACSPIQFEHPMLKNLELDLEPVVLLYETGDEILGGVHFPMNRFSIGTMERFGHNFSVFLRALLEMPERRIKDILLV